MGDKADYLANPGEAGPASALRPRRFLQPLGQLPSWFKYNLTALRCMVSLIGTDLGGSRVADRRLHDTRSYTSQPPAGVETLRREDTGPGLV